MSLLLVPYIVLCLLVLLTLHMRPGRDFLVPVFLLPWGALTPDVGANMPLAKVLYILLAAKYALRGRFSIGSMPRLPTLILVTLIGVASAGVTLATERVDIEFAGGDLRNGWLRVAVVAVSFLLSMAPLSLLMARGIIHSVPAILRTYVLSVVILCIIGIIQYAIFRVTGNDILPIGLFAMEEDQLRSGLGTAVGGGIDLRPGSLAGEPKVLGMFAATVIVLIPIFGRMLNRSRILLGAALVLALLAVFLTQSTSALITLPIGLGLFLGLRWLGRPLSISGVFFVYMAFAITLLGVSLYRVATEQEPANEYLIYLKENPTFAELLYDRTLGRLSVEDFDWVILKTFVADPVTSILGRGFGLGHLTAAPYIPDSWRHYMEGRLIFPKSGVTFFFVNGGLVMLVVMMIYLARLTPAAGHRLMHALPETGTIVRTAQAACVLLVVLLLMRLYILDVAMLVAGASYLLVRQTVLRNTRAPSISVPGNVGEPAAPRYPAVPQSDGRLR